MATALSFGVLAKNRRRELGLTQDELARRVGCAPITIRKIEADDLRPSIQIAERMAMALNIPLEERAAFVKLARMEKTPADEPKVTPMPTLEEIGSEDLSGRAIRGYALGERLGNGGMGAVYRAIQPLVEREVAIKIILPKYANHPDFIRRFEAEAQLVARLEHPHIVPLYDYWREPNVAYLVMRLLRGGSVQSLLRNGTALPPPTILRLVEQIGAALGAAHRAGVVHRDLKPANVLLDEDNNAYLADFGIAKNLSSFSSETQADVIIGSPDYISPEQIRSEFIRPQADIYTLGVMLYELLTGIVPFRGPTPFEVMHQHLTMPLPPLSVNRAGLPGSLDEIIKHATVKDPLQRYETVEDMLDDLRRALGKRISSRKGEFIDYQETLPPLVETDNPYKGLRSFGEGDAQDFFGREALLQQLLIRLGESGELSRFLTVVGPSGSGKSSVVKAGLIPSLRRGALPGSENWFIVEMMPGARPLEELEAALLRVAVNPPASLLEQFQSDSRGLIRAIRRSLPDNPNVELVLVIDQFEEIFTLLHDEKERSCFLGLLVAAALDENSRVRIIVTVRADFIDRPLAYMDFGEILRQRMEIVLPLTSDEMESAIVSPAERIGLRMEQGLVPIMLHDLADQPGALPLLQYALTELFEKRETNTLTKSTYQNIGGVLGALGRRAEEVFTGLNPEYQQIAKQLFLRLVTLGEGMEDTRRRALVLELENLQLGNRMNATEFSTAFKTTLDAFGRARLLSFDRDPGTRGPTVEVAHEAILREWSRLRDWLGESRTLVRMQRQLALAASEWESARRDDSFLLTGIKLAQYEGWLENKPVALTDHELMFLKACHTAGRKQEALEFARQQRELKTAERQSMATEQLRRRIMAGLVGISAVVLALLVFALVQLNISRAQRLGFQAQVAFTEQNYNAAALFAYQASQIHENDAAELVLSKLYYENFVPGKSLIGHTGGVSSLAWSTDGQLASASLDDTVIIWDITTGQPLQTLAGSEVAWSADGRLASASSDGAILIWDLATSQSAQTLQAYVASVTSLAWSADGRLASAYLDGTIILWNLNTGKPAQTLRGHTASVTSLAWSADGSLASASPSPDGTIIIWDLTRGKPTQTLRGYIQVNTYVPTPLAWSADGHLASATADGGVLIWDLTAGEPDQTLKGHTGGVTSLAWSTDGRLSSASDDGIIIIWDLTAGEPAQTLKGHTDGVTSLAWSTDGRLASASLDDTVVIWDLTTRKPAQALEGHTGSVTSLAWSADGGLASASDEGTILIWDLTTSKPAQVLKGHMASVTSLAWSADGRLASASVDNTVIIWDLALGRPAYTLRGLQVAWSAGDRLAYVSTDNTIFIRDLAGSGSVQTFNEHTHTVLSLAWSADERLAFALDEGVIIIWDPTAAEPALWLSEDANAIFNLAWSADGRLASASWDGTVILWDLATGSPAQTLRGHTASVTSVAWSADERLASASDDGTIIIWDLTTGKPAQTLTEHRPYAYVTPLAWSADGRLAFASADGIIKIAQGNLFKGKPCNIIYRNMTIEEWIAYQGSFYIYVPACPNLPYPTFNDPIYRNPFARMEVRLFTWQGRAILLGIVPVLLFILFVISRGLSKALYAHFDESTRDY
jgi:WD40 repeat protein/serine/threonine protein kinase/DNA-binding XRE family transcriptional regulator